MTTETNSVIRHLQKVLGNCGSPSRAVYIMVAQCIVIMRKAENLHELLLQAAVAAGSTTLLETDK